MKTPDEKQELLENTWDRFVRIHRERTMPFLVTVLLIGIINGVAMYLLFAWAFTQIRTEELFGRVQLFYALFLAVPFGIGTGYALASFFWLKFSKRI